MVRGLDVFKAHFAAFEDRYVLIGGTACSILMNEAGLDFRATKDLDIVLCIEALDQEFVQAFWQFVSKGQYQYRQQSTGDRQFYRFSHPEDATFPYEMELFSRKPDALQVPEDQHLVPIPVDDGIYYLSAILLNDDCYQFIHDGKEVVDGLSVVAPAHLIPLKAFAWLDLKEKRVAGVSIQEGNIRKHLNDVFRLYQLLAPDTLLPLVGVMRESFLRFLDHPELHTVDMSSIRLRRISVEQIIANLRRIYGFVE